MLAGMGDTGIWIWGKISLDRISPIAAARTIQHTDRGPKPRTRPSLCARDGTHHMGKKAGGEMFPCPRAGHVKSCVSLTTQEQRPGWIAIAAFRQGMTLIATVARRAQSQLARYPVKQFSLNEICDQPRLESEISRRGTPT